MLRRLFILASAVSLTMFAATAVVWVWSYVRPEWIVWAHCDTRLAHPPAGYGDMRFPDAPAADRSFELAFFRGGLKLRRERLLGTARELALDAAGRPARISAPGWHLVAHAVGASAGNDRTIVLFGPDWFNASPAVLGLEPDEDNLALDFESGQPGLPGTGTIGTYTRVGLRLWILLALTLVCPAWWLIRRVVQSPLIVAKTGSRPTEGRVAAIAHAWGVRRPVIVASVLWLLLCAAVVRWWVKSYRQQSQLIFFTSGPAETEWPT